MKIGSTDKQRQEKRSRSLRTLRFGFATLFIAVSGSLLFGTGTAAAQDSTPVTPSSCAVARTAAGYQIVVNGVAANADRIHIRNNGSQRERDGTFMGRFIGSAHGSTVTIERPDYNRSGVQHFAVRSVDGTRASDWRYCGSITFPSINCQVVANADGSNTISWSGGGGVIVYRNGQVVASTVETGFASWVDSNDNFNGVIARKDLVPGQRYHYSVDNVLDTSGTFYCGSVIAQGDSNRALPTSNCFADWTPGVGIEVTWSATTQAGTPTNADRYVIQRRRNGGTWYWAGRASPVQGNTQRWLDAGKDQFPDRFDYRVISQKNGVNSAPRGCGTEGF